MINAYKVLVRKFEGQRPLGRLRNWWEDNLGMDFRDTVWRSCGMDNLLAQEHGNETLDSIKGGKFLDKLSNY